MTQNQWVLWSERNSSEIIPLEMNQEMHVFMHLIFSAKFSVVLRKFNRHICVHAHSFLGNRKPFRRHSFWNILQLVVAYYFHRQNRFIPRAKALLWWQRQQAKETDKLTECTCIRMHKYTPSQTDSNKTVRKARRQQHKQEQPKKYAFSILVISRKYPRKPPYLLPLCTKYILFVPFAMSWIMAIKYMTWKKNI